MTMDEALGWLAASLMLLTFSCVDARTLRVCAVAANLAFIAYGLAAHLMPVVALHCVLLPVNLTRLVQAMARHRARCGPAGVLGHASVAPATRKADT